MKLVRLHVRGLKTLRALDLPEDGIGWSGEIPDTVMIGGVNGSGKTTLLDFIETALRSLHHPLHPMVRQLSPELHEEPEAPLPEEALVDFELGNGKSDPFRVRFLTGRDDFVERVTNDYSYGYRSPGLEGNRSFFAESKLATEKRLDFSLLPSLIYLPWDRSMTIPATSFKAAGLVQRPSEFVYRWQKPKEWSESIEAALYAARWADLNAKDKGQRATFFDSYATAFNEFFEGTKSLEWSETGELYVRITATGERHGLAHLSSGEQQVILLAAEILDRWRPGSMVMIDEPELHLHVHWQSKLWELLGRFRSQRGGQLIIATQSNHLFRIAPPGTAALLGTREP